MNLLPASGLSPVSGLRLTREAGTWYRAVNPRFLPSALGTSHTPGLASRYSPGALAKRPFQILYLAEDPTVALFEVAALFGSPAKPGGIVPNPKGVWATIAVRVNLTAVADLTDLAAQSALATTAQELTGDWLGYAQRTAATSVRAPVGVAPTQELGEALWRLRIAEGFRAISAKVPYSRVLVVFPSRLKPGSWISYRYQDTKGRWKTKTIPARAAVPP